MKANFDGDLKRQMRKYYAKANNYVITKILLLFSRCKMFKSYCATKYCSSMWFDKTFYPFVSNCENLFLVLGQELLTRTSH